MSANCREKLLLWISRVSIVVGLIPLLVIQPMCDCPAYYLATSAIGLLPLVCGPWLYRCVGAAFVLAALLFAQSDRSHAVYMRKQIEQIRADSVRENQ